MSRNKNKKREKLIYGIIGLGRFGKHIALNTSLVYGINDPLVGSGSNCKLTVPPNPSDIEELISITSVYKEDIKGINNGYPVLQWELN